MNSSDKVLSIELATCAVWLRKKVLSFSLELPVQTNINGLL